MDCELVKLKVPGMYTYWWNQSWNYTSKWVIGSTDIGYRCFLLVPSYFMSAISPTWDVACPSLGFGKQEDIVGNLKGWSSHILVVNLEKDYTLLKAIVLKTPTVLNLGSFFKETTSFSSRFIENKLPYFANSY